ncbi:hypothetical protein ACWC3X_36420 [Streptomyces populi]
MDLPQALVVAHQRAVLAEHVVNSLRAGAGGGHVDGAVAGGVAAGGDASGRGADEFAVVADVEGVVAAHDDRQVGVLFLQALHGRLGLADDRPVPRE